MNAKDYWIKREREHIAKMNAKNVDYEREMSRIYNQSYRSIETQIEAFYQRYANNNQIDLSTVKTLANATDVQALEDVVKRMVEDKDFSPYANQLLSMYNLKMKVSKLELLQNEIAVELIKNGVYTDKYINKTLTNETKEEIERQAGILGKSFDTFDNKYVKNVIGSSFHNATFSDNVWSNTTALKNQLDTFITQSIINGKHPNNVARDVRKMFGVSQGQAERLMRTESARVNAEIAKDNYKANGIKKYEWVAEPGACSICSPLDGKVFELKTAEYGNPKHPLFPMHPHCRCGIIPALDEEAYNEWLNALDKGSTTNQYINKTI